MDVIFPKKGKEMLKKCKIFENLSKDAQNLKIFWERGGGGGGGRGILSGILVSKRSVLS